MSEIKALEELRKLDGCIDIPMLKNKLCADTNTHNVIAALEAIADEIEAEIAERFMELPVDAEGVPIRIGDLLVLQHEVKEKPSEVESITFDGQDWYFTSSDGFLNAAGFSHVKPRTLESVLADLTNEVWEASCTCHTTWSDSGLDGIEKRYADEIRSLIGGEDA